jgi:hypothetical protein
MRILAASALLLSLTVGASGAMAGVYMCEDPVTGKKTFTDRACPATKEPGKKVRVESQTRRNHHGLKRDPVWNSDRNSSVSGRANLDEEDRVAASISGNGLLGADS